MKIVRAMLAVFIVATVAQPSTAQPARAPVESVTVTGTRDRHLIEGFVKSFAAPSRVAGKIAHWEVGICPLTVGLRPKFTKYITQRIKDVAAASGAPVSQEERCRANIEVLFSIHPQILLNNVRKSQPWLLGYSDNSHQTEKLATVTRPIQAWYMTATKDIDGQTVIDSGKNGPLFFASTGSRVSDGLRSTFYRVMIVVDPDKLMDYEIGSLADYIAMLALTQLNALDTCQQLPSIVNMLASGCGGKADALTDNDIAYLRGVYKMSPDMNLGTEKSQIAYQMGQSLGAGK